ncbi:hypothetical protein [Veronia nyctiphanis]|uniref:hypothetical protein n=1 Tax=Veronia nyctiphanis TaxID=1278244 RepID=UPI00100C0E42|nr:hypothetical protein [Veronia nyctiphanis]
MGQDTSEKQSKKFNFTYVPVVANGAALKNDAVKAVHEAYKNGGDSTSKLHNLVKNSKNDLSDLLTVMRKGNDQDWIDGEVDGMPARYIQDGDCYCSFVTSKLDDELAKVVGADKVHHNRVIHVQFSSSSGLTWYQKYLIEGGVDLGLSIAAEKLLLAGAKMFINKMSRLFANDRIQPGMREIELQNIVHEDLHAPQGLEAIEPDQGALQDLYQELDVAGIEIEFDLEETLMAQLLNGAAFGGELIVVAVIAIVIDLLINQLFKEYHFSFEVYNITSKPLTDLGFPYMDNVDKSAAKGTSTNVLGPATIGNPQCSPIPGFKTNEPIISIASYYMVNDSTFFEGLGMIFNANLDIKNISNVCAVADIPRFSDNSISALFNVDKEKFESTYKHQEGANKVLRVEKNCDDFSVVMTMSKLSGADENSYCSNLFITDNNTMNDLLAYIEKTEEKEPVT